MHKRTRLIGALALGCTVALVAPNGALGAAKKATKKKVTAKATTTVATPATVAVATPTSGAAPAATGGKIVFGLEAESSEGWLPPSSQWAVSGQQVSYAVFERLTAINDKGEVSGWLAESFTVSPDKKVYTFKIRPGIKFHNGEPLNADAVKLNFDYLACGSVTATAYLPLNGAQAACSKESPSKLLAGVTSDGNMTVTVTMFIPWVGFPSYLTGQPGTIAAPAQLKANDRNNPIGTGPFKFKEWKVGDHFTAVKNPDYWQKGLPKSDEIEFRPIVDESARLAQLQAGQIDFTHTANLLTQREMLDLQKAGKIKLVQSEAFGEVSYNMLRVDVPPFNNQDCRVAAAYGLDNDTLIKLRAPGATRADGPYPKGAVGYLADSGYPKFNIDKAKEFYAKCKATVGGGRDVEFTLGTTNVPDNIETQAIQKQMMERVGFSVKTVNIEQQKYIGTALVGAFQWFQWRNHGGVDPDQQRIWWHTETATPAPGFALNFGRIKDGQIDAALDQIRSNSDPAVRKQASEAINRQFAEQAYNLWGWRTRWALAYCAKCGGFEDQRNASGQKVPDLPSGHVAGVAFLFKG